MLVSPGRFPFLQCRNKERLYIWIIKLNLNQPGCSIFHSKFIAMNTTATHRVFLCFLLLTFYCFGAAVMNEWVQYQSWADLGQYISVADFARWHTATNKLIIPVLVLPMALLTMIAFSLIWLLPPLIPRWTLWVVLSCHVVAWCSTLFIQVPIEMQLEQQGYSSALMQQLLRTDWIRKVAFLVEIPVVIFMASYLFKNIRSVK